MSKKRVNFDCPIEVLEPFDAMVEREWKYPDRTTAIIDAMQHLLKLNEKEAQA